MSAGGGGGARRWVPVGPGGACSPIRQCPRAVFCGSVERLDITLRSAGALAVIVYIME